jgi:hypothetical protein
MGLESSAKGFSKSLEEAKKLEKQFKAAKTPQEKDKVKKKLDALQKTAKGHLDAIATAQAKEAQMLKDIIQNMGS